jgi:hypothetical protein
MGIVDRELQPHLKRVAQDYLANKHKWLFIFKNNKLQEASFLKNSERHNSERQNAAVKFREQGNVCMKEHDFLRARYMYTESLAAAIEGPLASLAYCNRYIQ